MTTTKSTKKHELGQFFTPTPIADFMASLFHCKEKELHLLDPGAGTGELSLALIRRLCKEPHKPKKIFVTAYEIDEEIIQELEKNLIACKRISNEVNIEFDFTILNEDFISASVSLLNDKLFGEPTRFNAAIVNPPYYKIRSDSKIRKLLRIAGIETSNIYTGFLYLIIQLLAENGELVAITPRSFCNGPYFKPFRQELLDVMAIQHVHTFESRTEAFKQDNVLQENLIFHAIKSSVKPEKVTISSSNGKLNEIISRQDIKYSDLVSPVDPERFIHVLTTQSHLDVKQLVQKLNYSLSELGLNISTGRVVDFRAKAFLNKNPEQNTVPLIYPCHFNGKYVHWPVSNNKKANAITNNAKTLDLLIPSDTYVLLKRFTSKEEKKRLVACIYNPKMVKSHYVAFENHINYFHCNGHGLNEFIALGLYAYLNSTIVDKYFRQFSGHTQVNATDLKTMKYPSPDKLIKLGHRLKNGIPNQQMIDKLVMEEIFHKDG